MNEKITIDIYGIKTVSGSSINILEDGNMLLSPFYASIRDIELGFGDDFEFSESFQDRISEIIFNKSIYIDMFLRGKRINLSEEEIMYLKYQYVVCAVTYEAGNRIYIGSLKSNKVRKEIGDFIVERSMTYDTSYIDKTANDAKSCMDDILDAISSMSDSLIASFVKGENNPGSTKSYRLWHHPKYRSHVPIASNKILEADGKYYKTGAGYGN